MQSKTNREMRNRDGNAAVSERDGPHDEAIAAGSSISDWIEEIRKGWAQGAANTLELARVVSAARNALPHGGWSALWKSTKMPFGKRTGYLLVAVGDGLGWANVHVCAHLPAALRTLCHLAKLDRITVERLIREGVIHPALKESEAKELATRFRGTSVSDRSRKLSVQQWLRRCNEFVGANLKSWKTRDRELATQGLAQLIREIGSGPVGSEQRSDYLASSSGRNDSGAAARIFISPRLHTI